jgi:NAD(P)-dependent dehydrogenase (short-subunit alcohol dehydrogenase family)
MGSLEGQTALVTGGSRGIGRAIVLMLAEAGAEILLHYNRNESAAQAVARELPRPPQLLKADLQSPKAIEAMFTSLAGLRLDILVNNAGIWGQTPLGATSLDDLRAMLDVNVGSVFLVTQAACLCCARELESSICLPLQQGWGSARGGVCTAPQRRRWIHSLRVGPWSWLPGKSA